MRKPRDAAAMGYGPPECRWLEGVFASLAHGHRLRIFGLLLERPRYVCELVEASGLMQPTVSHHVAQLQLAGLVVSEREPFDHRWIRYAVSPHAVLRLSEALADWGDRAAMASAVPPLLRPAASCRLASSRAVA